MKTMYANLFDYANYRDFLKEYQKNRFAADKTYTRTSICQRLGLPNTKSFFRDVVAGKNITTTFVERFIQAFEFNNKESRYFRVLVQFTQSQSEEERERLFDQLIALNQTPMRFIESDSYEFYRARHHSVVRALLDVIPVTNNYKYLGNRLLPPITAKEAKASLELLKRLRMAGRDETGRWVQTDKNASAGYCGKNEAIKQYQLGKLEQGKRAMLSPFKVPSKTLTMTVSLSNSMLEKLGKKVDKFRSEVRSMIHKDENPSQQVYQINLQYFPQASIKKDNP